MKRNGFTLVELLAVIAILGLLIVIAATRGFGAFNKTKESINQIEENNLLEAAKTYLVEIDNEICPSSISAEDCKVRRDACLVGCEVTVGVLESEGFFNDKKNKCADDAKILLKITEDESGNTVGYKAEKITGEICVN